MPGKLASLGLLRGPKGDSGATGPAGADGVGGGGGAVHVNTLTDLRSVSPEPANGTVYYVGADPEAFVYDRTSGIGFVDDGDTQIRISLGATPVALGSNGRFYRSTHSATVATFAALRLAVSGKYRHITVQARSSLGDGGGGTFHDVTGVLSTADDDGVFIHAGARVFKRDFDGALHTEWFGLVPSAAVVHDGNGTDVARAATNKTALLAAFAAAQSMGGREIIAPVGNFPITAGTGCFKISNYSGITLRGQGIKTTFFDPTVAATVTEPSASGATIAWCYACTKVYFKDIRVIGSADYAAQVPASIIRTDKKGIYFQTDNSGNCVDCGIEDVWFEGIEGEVFYFDGTVISQPTRVTAKNMHTLNCIENMFNGVGAGLDCGVEGLFCENTGQSILQIGGTRVYARNIRGVQTNGIKTTADVFLIYGSDSDPSFTVEDFKLDGFDVRGGGVTSNLIVVGFAAAPHKGTLKNGKLTNCKINTDSGNKNGLLKFFAGEQFIPGNNVKLKGIDVRDIELNECGGSAGVGSKISAISFAGGVTDGDDFAVTVTGLKIRNGLNGNVNRAVRIHDDVPASNRIQINQVSHDIQGVGASPYLFDVAPWKDYATTRRVVGLTDAEKLASLISHLGQLALVEDIGFQPADFTTVGVRAFYDAGRYVQLGTVPRKTGTSPASSISGDLQQTIGLKYKITTGGPRGTAKFDWSIDNGATWIATGVFTGASVELEQIGIILAFGVGTHVVNDTFEATVEKWYDVNGGPSGALFLVQSTAAKQFLYKVAGGPNGKPCLSAGGVDCYMSIAYSRPIPSFLYAVLKDEAAFGAGNETALDALTANSMRLFRSANTQWTMTETGGIGELLLLPGADPQNFHMLECYFNNASSEGGEDGASLGTGTCGTGVANDGLSIGGFGGASAFFHGSYCKLIDCDAKPSTAEGNAMRASLLAEYGL